MDVRTSFRMLLTAWSTNLLVVSAVALAPPATDAQSGPAESPAGEDRISASNGKLDIRFREVDIFDSLELLSEQTKTNIVVQNGVSGNVSLVLRGVTFDEALRAILRTNNLTFELRDGIIYVGPEKKEPAPQVDKTTHAVRVFRLNYVKALDAEAFIKPLLDPTCSVTRTGDPEEGIGSDKESAGGFKPAGRELLVVAAPPPLLEVIAQVITELDTRPPQVLVEATIMRATLNDQNALGIDFNTLMGVDLTVLAAVSPGVTDVTVGNVPANRLSETNATIRTDFNNLVPSGGLTFGILKDHVASFVRALEQVTDVTIMANPKVLTLNKQRGEVIVGRRDGYITTTVTETAAIQSVEFLETGTKLIFRPFVTGDGFVRMEIHPEDSNGGLTAANLPFQETTEATTNVLLRDGHTILIGGMFRERSTASKNQVPVVGEIPVLGKLFGVTQDQTVREEVVILLTVHVLEDDPAQSGALAELGQDLERIRVGARHGMMGTGREQLAEARYHAALEALREGRVDEALASANHALHMNPRHIDALRLRERLLSERTWNATGSIMRSFMAELLERDAGRPPRPTFGQPDVEALLKDEPPSPPAPARENP